ncbi:MAG: exonuclease SbcCD subunit D C-terminal domain-containing protein [Synergistaceae bacterium]|nr:exonuclease SbcCD subunit D C-terminal domain-containing protein [Synergistaceae bacterium]
MSKRILHTSDWHTGRKLKEHDRLEEFRKFFAWLEDVIARENIDALIVSGDIFDTTAPSPKAQELYYSFLGTTSCRNTVIISGNHDSPSLIDAPAEIMKLCKTHVIGRAYDDSSKEAIILYDPDGQPEFIVCAVPYLRDRDIRRASPDDDPESIERSMKDGIMKHYSGAIGRALEIRGDSDVPVIAMGHLFLEAGRTLEDEGVRSLYVGTAVKVGTDIFPEDVAYTALGHLHSPQEVGRENIRYSGSPVAMTFGEASGPAKTVSIVEFEGRNFSGVKEIPVPVFQRLERVSGGSVQEIGRKIEALGSENVSIWLEVTYTGSEAIGDIQGSLEDYVRDYPLLEILSVRDEGSYKDITEDLEGFTGKTLDDITPERMFERLIEGRDYSEEQRETFKAMYREILHKIAAGEN